MKQGLNTHLIQTQKLRMTQDLRQSIELLQLNNLELAQKIELEVMENPMLELLESERSIDINPEDSMVVKNRESSRDLKRDLAWENSFNNNESYEMRSLQGLGQNRLSGTSEDSDRFQNFIEGTIYREESLQELIWNDASLVFDKEQHLDIARLIISSLDDKGFQSEDIFHLAKSMGFTDKNEVNFVLRKIQEMEPIGLAARDVHDSLMIQARIKYPQESHLLTLIKEEFRNISRLDKGELAKRLDVDIPEIVRNLELLTTLKPHPASEISKDKIKYIVPDLFIFVENNHIEIIINDRWLPKVQIQKDYQDLLSVKSEIMVKKEDKEYLNKKMNSANWLIRGIEQRRKTLYSVMLEITLHQRDFFFKGPSALVPLALQDIAKRLELNKSTISRVTNGKYAQTPFGLFELKYFFPRKLHTLNGDSIISRNVLERIREIIDLEKKPLSDQEIADLLAGDGVKIARRTVAKYREELGILTSSQRRKIIKQ